jgi:putative salt-induced outer membrane protein YdiY
MTKHGLRATTLALTFLWSVAAYADVVLTSDGSRIVGTIECVADGKLTIVTDIVGRVEIETSKIISISTDGRVNVELGGGDTVVGLMEPSSEGSASVVHSDLGDIAIAASSIVHLWPDGAESPEETAARKKAEAEIEAAKPKWTVTMEARASLDEGNTDSLKAKGRLDVKRKTKTDLLTFHVSGEYDESDDKRSTNEYLGGVRYEQSLSDLWYWYARTKLEFDEFEDLDLRATAAAGVGYYWLKRPDHELKTSLGLGYRHEAFDNGHTDDAAVVDFGLDYRWDLSPWAQFTHSADYSPDIEDTDDYRFTLDTALLVPFKDDRWAWKLGMRNEYNSRPQGDLDRLDNTYYTSIVLSLKR